GGGEGYISGGGSGGGGGSSYAISGTIATDSTGTPVVKISWSLPPPYISLGVKDALHSDATWDDTETAPAQAKAAAAVSQTNSVVPTGTVTYDLYTQTSCGGSSAATQQVNLDGSGAVPVSLASGDLGAGDYSYKASY